jgi:hypothetical protein
MSGVEVKPQTIYLLCLLDLADAVASGSEIC